MPSQQTRDAQWLGRAEGAYLGMAIGDALGATLEFMTPREITHHHGVHREISGGGWLRLRPGQVTDDTTMALALGESILAEGTVNAQAVAAAFDGWMRAKPVDIGNTVRRGILHWRNTGKSCVPYREEDAGNGACMRVLPVALFMLGSAPGEVERAVLTQNHTTHNNALSDNGTLAVVHMVQQLLEGADKAALLDGPYRTLVRLHPEYNFRKRREENPSGFIVHTLRAVFQAFFDSDNFESCLVDVVNRGGDADTTGAIAGMLAGACYGVDAIPARWLKRLEPEVTVRCRDQAARLLGA